MAGSEQQPVSIDHLRPEQALPSSAPKSVESTKVERQKDAQEILFEAVRAQGLQEVARALALGEFDFSRFNELNIATIDLLTGKLKVFDVSYVPFSQEESVDAQAQAKELLMLKREQELLDARRADSRATDESFARQLADETDVAARIEAAQKVLGKHIAVSTHRERDPQAEAMMMASLDTPAYQRALREQQSGQPSGKDSDKPDSKKSAAGLTHTVTAAGYILTSIVPQQAVISEIGRHQDKDQASDTQDGDVVHPLQDAPQTTPPPASPTTHRIFLPFGARPRMPGDGTATPKDTETPPAPTVTPTEYAPPIPSNTATVGATATFSPTATIGLPTATVEAPTPTITPEVLQANEFIFTGTELLFANDKFGIWGTSDDFDQEGKKATIIGKTSQGVPIVEIAGVQMLLPGHNIEGIDLEVIPAPVRTITMASDQFPYEITNHADRSEDYYVENSYVMTDVEGPFGYTLQGDVPVGAIIRIHHSGGPNLTTSFTRTETGYTITDPRGQRESFVLGADKAFEIKIAPTEAGHTIQVLSTDDDLLLSEIPIRKLGAGVAHITTSGELRLDTITFSSEATVTNVETGGPYETRKNSGLLALTGVNLGVSDDFGLSQEMIAAGGVQVMHENLSYSILSGSSREIMLREIEIKMEHARMTGLKTNMTVSFDEGAFGTKSPQDVLNYISDIQMLARGSDLTINILNSNGEINIAKSVLTALGIAKSNPAGAAQLISNLSGRLSVLSQGYSPAIFLGNGGGLTGGQKNKIIETLQSIADEEVPIAGVFFGASDSSQTEISAIASKIKDTGRYVGLSLSNPRFNRVGMRDLGRLLRMRVLSEISINLTNNLADASFLAQGPDGFVVYRTASSNGPVPGTFFGDLLDGYTSN